MIGKIIDLNITDALVSFKDGSIANVSISHLPYSAKIGDTVNINPNSTSMTNDKLKSTSSVNIF